VATAGDVDGNGYADVVLGAHGYAGGWGKVYLYRGGASGLPATASWTAVGNGTSVTNLGWSVATAGDVNGDGYADVIVGAGIGNATGKALVYLGGASGLQAAASWTVAGEPPTSTLFGASVATGGGRQRDGYADVVVGDYN